MDTSYNEPNRAQTQRLKNLGRLTDEELRSPIGEHWTVAVAIAHIQYWDGRNLGVLEAWRRHDVPLNQWAKDETVLNDVLLPLWRTLEPREALAQAVKTAEALDRVVEDLTPVEAKSVAAQRSRALDRSVHRSEHLDEIDRAVGSS